MKRAVNLLAETLSLPFSELFLQYDPLSVSGRNLLSSEKPSGQIVVDLDKHISNAALKISRYLNQHLEIPSIAILRGFLQYCFRGSDVVSCAQRNGINQAEAVFNHYYIERLYSIADLLITTRNGYAVLRPWNGEERENLFRAYDEVGMIADEEASFSPVRIELWNSLLRCLPENLLISCYAAIRSFDIEDVVQQRHASLQMLLSFGNSIRISDVLLDSVLNKGMAETHIHANASRTFDLIWEKMIAEALHGNSVFEKAQYILPYKKEITENEIAQIVREAAIVRVVMAAYLLKESSRFDKFIESGKLSYRLARSFQVGAKEILKTGHPNSPLSRFYMPEDGIWDCKKGKGIDIWTLLALPIALKGPCPYLADTCFQTWSLLHIRKYPEDYFFTCMFLYYVRLKNSAYRLRVQDGKNKGLSYFQRYYDLSTDKGNGSADEGIRNVIFTAINDNRMLKTELRYAPPLFKADDLKKASDEIESKIIDGIQRFIKDHVYVLLIKNVNIQEDLVDFEKDYEDRWRVLLDSIHNGKRGELIRLLSKYHISTRTKPIHRLGIIYHLIKKDDNTECCFIKKSDSEREEYSKFAFGNERFIYEASAKAISQIRRVSPCVARLLVGIDAASLEIPTEPWVFAPAFRMAKHENSYWGKGEDRNNRKPLLGVTYHVGEDFRHPLSGLRHLDEAFSFLDFHPGDRMGHGLILGVDLDRWFSLNGMISMPRIEWMENNLWLWHLLTKDSRVAGLAKYTKIIEDQILEAARDIYHGLNGITVNMLYQSYSMKAKSTNQILKVAESVAGKCNRDGNCLKELKDAKFFPCWKSNDERQSGVWRDDLLVLSHHCELFRQRMKRPVLIKSTPIQKEISIILQKYMREKMASNGIIIEMNPSSNTIIGEMDGVLNHPISILRKGKKVMSTINTDDPSVFNANVPNEYAQVYYALRYNGMTVDEALKEIDDMRDTALRTSFVGEPLPLSDLMNEYEEVLVNLYKYRNKKACE